jgi:hypothetical protein
MACAEFFAMDKGETWGVGHYLWVLALLVKVEGRRLTSTTTQFREEMTVSRPV